MMTMRPAIGLLLACMTLGASAAPAQTPPASPIPTSPAPTGSTETVAPRADAGESEITPEKLAAAHDLLTAMHAQSNALEMFAGLRGVLISNIQQRSGKPEAEVAGIVDDLLMPAITSRFGEFIDTMAHVQASVYSVDEMHELTAFYQTPLGQRVIVLMPKIGAMSFEAGQEWGKRVTIEALQKNADELRKRGAAL